MKRGNIMDDDVECLEETKKEYLAAIMVLLEKCNDFSLLDFVLKLLQKSCCYIE